MNALIGIKNVYEDVKPELCFKLSIIFVQLFKISIIF